MRIRWTSDRPWDLWAVAGLVAAAALAVFLDVTPWLRVPLGLAFVLAVPGYAFVAALFPERRRGEVAAKQKVDMAPRRGLEPLERAALSLGLSIAIVPLLGLALNFTPWGISLTSLLGAVGAFTLACVGAAWWRRRQLPSDERFAPGIAVDSAAWATVDRLPQTHRLGLLGKAFRSPRLHTGLVALAITGVALSMAKLRTMEGLSALDGGPYLRLGIPFLASLAVLFTEAQVAPSRLLRTVSLAGVALGTIGAQAILYPYGRLHDTYRNTAWSVLLFDHLHHFDAAGAGEGQSYLSSWPGSFILTGAAGAVAGIPYGGLVRFAPLFLATAYLAVLALLSSTLFPRMGLPRAAFWALAAAFFVLAPRMTARTNVAPQTVGYVLALFAFAILLARPTDRRFLMLATLCSAALVMTHLITPFALLFAMAAFAGVAMLRGASGSRPVWNVPPILVVLLVAWTVYVGAGDTVIGLAYGRALLEQPPPVLVQPLVAPDRALSLFNLFDGLSLRLLLALGTALLVAAALRLRSRARHLVPFVAFALPFMVPWLVGISDFRDRFLLFSLPAVAVSWAVIAQPGWKEEFVRIMGSLHAPRWTRGLGTLAIAGLGCALFLTLPLAQNWDVTETVSKGEVSTMDHAAAVVPEGTLVAVGLYPALHDPGGYENVSWRRESGFFSTSLFFEGKVHPGDLFPMLESYRNNYVRQFAAVDNPYAAFESKMASLNPTIYDQGQNRILLVDRVVHTDT